MSDHIYVERKMLEECLQLFKLTQQFLKEVFGVEPDSELMKDSVITRLEKCLTK